MRVLRVVSVNLSLILLGSVIAFGIAEVVLRIYQPFEFRLSAGRFVLHTNKQYVYNPGVPKLDDTIIYTMNSLGFRGPDPPTDFEDHLTIIPSAVAPQKRLLYPMTRPGPTIWAPSWVKYSQRSG